MADDEDKVVDLGDAKSVKEVSKAAKAREQKKLEFIKAAMLREDGRAWFHDFLVATHCFQNPFSAASETQTAFNCGEMNIGLQVLGDLNYHCPREYLIMMEESRGRNPPSSTTVAAPASAPAPSGASAAPAAADFAGSSPD